ncbi:hypothetical protein BUY11_10705 [Staphylococcus chromogenes]|uniref:Rha family transcriptional regulator n=1 Tax=Staphylococcus chromogenes TaxID=46126 RepID=UPI000D1CC0A5|nr:Rha family transcriptional regulator [Staphylococcus chromogenes]PTF40660.1 hypothetical protein BUY11_10705 [Staphylococcus chromogenes]
MQALQVIEKNNEFYVDSREVAEMVGKRHAHLIRDIRRHIKDLSESNIAYEKYFIKSFYFDKSNRKRVKYMLSKQGLIYYGIRQHGNSGTIFTALFVSYVNDDPSKIDNLQKVFNLLLHSINNAFGELYFQRIFDENYQEIIKNSEKIDKKYDKKNIPDNYLLVNGKETPVEMKLNNFDLKALNQLTRYMKTYNCEQGIAIAEKLTVLLPSNIKFIPLKEIKKYGD